MMRTSDTILSHTPARTICLIVTSPDPNATAFDGVATGSMNAEHTANVTVIVMSSGSSPMPTATAPKIGRNAAAVAVFDVSSVSTTLTTATARRTTHPGTEV